MIINNTIINSPNKTISKQLKTNYSHPELIYQDDKLVNTPFTGNLKTFLNKLFPGNKEKEKRYNFLEFLDKDRFSINQSITDANKDFTNNFFKTLSAMSGYIKGYLDQGYITEEKAQKICYTANKCLSLIVDKINSNELTVEKFNHYLNKDIEACMVLAHSNGLKHLNFLLMDLQDN